MNIKKEFDELTIADELEESEETINGIVNIAMKYAPEYDIEAICEEILSEENGK